MRDVLVHWEFGVDVTISDVFQQHDTIKQLWIVFDGSEKDLSITYG